MPSIKILKHKRSRVETTTSEVEADGLTVTDHEHVVREKVWATFEITDAAPVRKTRRSTREIQPEQFQICYESVNGEPWTRASSSDASIVGRNVKQDGTLGAEDTVRYYDFPDELKALYATGNYGLQEGGPAFEWINQEYPR